MDRDREADVKRNLRKNVRRRVFHLTSIGDKGWARRDAERKFASPRIKHVFVFNEDLCGADLQL